MSTEANPFAAFAGHKYLNLETFRKNGVGVKTPVWFAQAPSGSSDADAIYVYTIGNSGKAKRIRNSPRVRIAPCDVRGNILGDWIEARAEIVHGQAESRGTLLLNQKYFPWKQLLNFSASFRRRDRIVFAIRPA